MRWTSHHFMAIDVALAKGLTVEVRGQKITFAPLALDDLASIVAASRSIGLDLWRQHELARGLQPHEWRLHTMELNAILFGAMPQSTLDYMSNPQIRRLILTLSIRRGLPDERKAEADAIAAVKRFMAGESVADLAHAYCVPVGVIEGAIRAFVTLED